VVVKINELLSDRAGKSWRWRILYIRAILDKKRYAHFYEHNMGGKDDLYHSVEYNGKNCWTLPPVNGGTVVK